MDNKLTGQSHGSDTAAQSHGEQENRPDVKELFKNNRFTVVDSNEGDSFRSVKTSRFQRCLRYYWTVPFLASARVN